MIAGGALARFPFGQGPAALVEAGAGPDVGEFYAQARTGRVWSRSGVTTSGAERAYQRMAAASADGLDPSAYLTPELRAAWALSHQQGADAVALAHFDALMSRAFLRFTRDLSQPTRENAFLIVDAAAVAADRLESDLLAQLESGRADGDAVDSVTRMHPDYESLRTALQTWRRLWRDLPAVAIEPGPTVTTGRQDPRLTALRMRLGVSADAVEKTDRMDLVLSAKLSAFQAWHGLAPDGELNLATVQALNQRPAFYERMILGNMDRLRQLPRLPSHRYIQVNLAAAELTAVEEGLEKRRMRVVVGRPETPTPALAGVIRYAVLSPYWNIPQDLVREKIAPEIGRRGEASLGGRRLQVLSDWSPSARVLDPADIDWRAVKEGRKRVRVRQEPGPGNMMGEAKFILPNDLGIYLHDTPDKALFGRARRQFSAGCVRVEDAAWLGRWLLGEATGEVRTGAPEQRVDLREPVPVYLLYQTVTLRPGGGLTLHGDPYGLDPSAAR